MMAGGDWFAVFLLLVTTTILQVRLVDGELHVDTEDINKTITSKNGVVIDCVYIHKQTTLKHPMFKNHKIQVYEHGVTRSSGDHGGHMAPSSFMQEWHSSGSCPIGTIPIRRMPKNAVNPDIAMIQPFHPSSHRFVMDGFNSPTDEFAVAVGLNWPYHGASALLPSYRPAKLEPHESSSTCIVIAATVNRTWVGDHGPGDFPPDVTNQVVVGLLASKSIFGNDNPNLYIYYTSDGGKRKRCFNFLCHGFVQTSSKIALGTSFINGGSSITYEGVPYVAMSIHKVPGQQQWWVSVNDTVIGYFPHTLFPTFFPESYINQLGGFVHNSRPNGVHTDTTMGNGRTPESGGSAVIKAYLAVAANGMDKKDRPVTLGATAPKCYDAAVLGENLQVPGYDITYGGPGGSGCDQ